jgi:alkylated DNA nucleotide flippase Atl1
VNWKDLVDVLERKVSAGNVTTYSEVSNWAYGVPNRNQPVRSLLVGARNHGYQKLTNRVVGADGKLAELPDGSDQQRQQLLCEGVLFDDDGRVDLTKVVPVVLRRSAGRGIVESLNDVNAKGTDIWTTPN